MPIYLVNCDYCKVRFERSFKYMNRNKKLGHKNYCSRKCVYGAQSKARSGKNNPMYGVHRYGENAPRYNGGPTIQRILCDRPECSVSFNKLKKRIVYNKKHGHKNYCSRKCSIIVSNIKRKCSDKTKKKMSLSAFLRYGNKYLTEENRLERTSLKNKQFKKEILKRDNYTCQTCNKKGGNLEVDHIMPWSLYKQLRYDPENCRTLCKPCHKEYGANPQWDRWAVSVIGNPIFSC